MSRRECAAVCPLPFSQITPAITDRVPPAVRTLVANCNKSRKAWTECAAHNLSAPRSLVSAALRLVSETPAGVHTRCRALELGAEPRPRGPLCWVPPVATSQRTHSPRLLCLLHALVLLQHQSSLISGVHWQVTEMPNNLIIPEAEHGQMSGHCLGLVCQTFAAGTPKGNTQTELRKADGPAS